MFQLLFFSSVSVHELKRAFVATPYQAHCAAAKAAVDALSAVIAVEEGPRGVRSNVIAPGPISGTAGVERLRSLNDAPTFFPLGRMGQPDEIARASN